MQTMQSVEDSTTLFSSASRRRMPMAYASARQVCWSSERIVAATNKLPSTTANGTTSSAKRGHAYRRTLRCGEHGAARCDHQRVLSPAAFLEEQRARDGPKREQHEVLPRRRRAQ